MAKKKKKEHLVIVGGKVPPDLRKKAEQQAAGRRWTLSQYVCFALENQLANDTQARPANA